MEAPPSNQDGLHRIQVIQRTQEVFGRTLKPHLSPPDRPKTEIDAIYGLAQGRAVIAQQALRSVRLLQTVAEHVANDYLWPVPFTLEMQSCGYPNAQWDLKTHRLVLCYELAAEFADLYHDYGGLKGLRTAATSNEKLTREPIRKTSKHGVKRKRKLR
jgi:hypothetical protein